MMVFYILALLCFFLAGVDALLIKNLTTWGLFFLTLGLLSGRSWWPINRPRGP